MFLPLAMALLMNAPTPRPDDWAVPLSIAEVGNLNKVNDSLYRCQQPSAEGFRNLVDSLGIRTVINLRAFHTDKDELEGIDVELHELDMKTWHIEDEDVIEALRIIKWSGKGPFLVHCQHGADRTGTINAMYRMVFQGWPREKAMEEMVDGGYGFHALWRNILGYLEEVDIERIKAAVDAPP